MNTRHPGYIRFAPLVILLLTFTISGAVGWTGNDVIRWGHVILLGSATSLLSVGPRTRLGRVLRGLVVGFAVSLVLVAIGLVVGWVRAPTNFYNDGGPIGALLVIEFYLGLPLIVLAGLFSALLPVHPSSGRTWWGGL